MNLFKFQLGLLRIPSRLRGFAISLWILLNGGKCGKGLIIESGFRFKFPPHQGIRFGDRVCLGKGTTLDIPLGSFLEIGNNVSLTGYTYISSAKKVVIGNDVIIGEFCSIRDANHGYGIDMGLIKDQPMQPLAIIIGSDIWVGRGVAILRGANIKDGCIIAANAVVTSNTFVENAIIAGIPAKIIRNRYDHLGKT